MRLLDLCAQYNLDPNHLEQFVINSGFPCAGNRGDLIVNDADVSTILSNYQQELLRYQNTYNNMQYTIQTSGNIMTTTGESFEGYSIVRYAGYISGEVCELIPNNEFWADNQIVTNMSNHLVNARQNALQQLERAAYNLGCNGIIGISFDYLDLQSKKTDGLRGQMVLMGPTELLVVANGTAVQIVPK